MPDLDNVIDYKSPVDYVCEKISNNYCKMTIRVDQYITAQSTSSVGYFINLYGALQSMQSSFLSHFPAGSSINYTSDTLFLETGWIIATSSLKREEFDFYKVFVKEPISAMNGSLEDGEMYVSIQVSGTNITGDYRLGYEAVIYIQINN